MKCNYKKRNNNNFTGAKNMTKRRSYFTNPEIIEMYKKSGYTDERHFAVSHIMEAVGEKHCSYEEFKTSLFHTLCYGMHKNSSIEVVSEDSEQITLCLDIEDMHKQYIYLLDCIF